TTSPRAWPRSPKSNPPSHTQPGSRALLAQTRSCAAVGALSPQNTATSVWCQTLCMWFISRMNFSSHGRKSVVFQLDIVAKKTSVYTVSERCQTLCIWLFYNENFRRDGRKFSVVL